VVSCYIVSALCAAAGQAVLGWRFIVSRRRIARCPIVGRLGRPFSERPVDDRTPPSVSACHRCGYSHRKVTGTFIHRDDSCVNGPTWFQDLSGRSAPSSPALFASCLAAALPLLPPGGQAEHHDGPDEMMRSNVSPLEREPASQKGVRFWPGEDNGC
jgi:hypothetical protein